MIIGLQGGARAELDIDALLRKRAGVIGDRAAVRPVERPQVKAEIVEQVRGRACGR